FRGLAVAGLERDWAEVPYPEKRGLVDAVLAAGADDPARAAAERIGYARVTAGFRGEIAALVAEAKNRSGRAADQAADRN
ncbi:MAG: hypothetical protein RIM80_07360, partial [Alphaproteobacteria bacterium]